MTELKTSLHQLIDQIEDPAALEMIYGIVYHQINNGEGKLWAELSKSQQKEVIDRLSEINEPESHYSQESMKQANKKWLK